MTRTSLPSVYMPPTHYGFGNGNTLLLSLFIVFMVVFCALSEQEGPRLSQKIIKLFVLVRMRPATTFSDIFRKKSF
jgi:hypothetical protein